MAKTNLQKKRPSRDTSLATQIEMANACKVGDAERVAELLEINPALANSDSTWTPIHYAAREGHADGKKTLSTPAPIRIHTSICCEIMPVRPR